MFSTIRNVLGLIFFVALIFVWRKGSSRFGRKKMVIAAVISVALVIILAFIPLENTVVTFSTPEEAFGHYYVGDYDNMDIVEGELTTFVVGKKEGVEKFLIIPKTEKGWKVGLGIDIKWVVNSRSDGLVINVFQYKGTDEYFIVIRDLFGTVHEISDAHGSNFIKGKRDDKADNKKLVTYYAYIPYFSDEYTLVVNGTEIILK